MLVTLPIDQLKEHPQQEEFFQRLSGKAWEEFYSDVNARGIQQPIVVSDRTGEFVITDGHQRVRAAKYLGWLDMPCLVNSFPDEREEVRCLVMNNVQRRQLSREELDKALKWWITNYAVQSNRRIAEQFGVSHVTVEAKRDELETTGQIDQLDKLEGKDGKLRPRSQPKREVVAKTDNLEAAGEKVTSEVTNSEVVQQTGRLGIEHRPPVMVDAPAKPPGWTATETRKKLEHIFQGLTALDPDECREELERDQTFRAYALAAKRQLDAMLEVEQPKNLITVQN